MIGKFFRLVKRTSDWIRWKINPIKYARSLGVTFGKNCKFESFGFGTEPWLISMGDHVEIAGNVTFINHDGATWVLRENPKYKSVIRFGKIVIGSNVFIGHGTVLLPGITIGDNVVVGAGSIVTRDIPSNSIAVGNPARVISTYEAYAEKCLRETPDYDLDRFKKNKKEEILRILSDH